MITATTRLVALLGHPVAHSLSPKMQNAAFAALALDWAYVALDVPPEQIADAVQGLAAAGFAGANVTAPHKLAVAELVGADVPSVNTLVFRDGRIEGHSTDAAILDGLAAERPVVLGDGGAARAFLAALPEARAFARKGDWPPDVGGADLVVNATSARDEAARRAAPRPDARRPAVPGLGDGSGRARVGRPRLRRARRPGGPGRAVVRALDRGRRTRRRDALGRRGA